MSATFFLVVGQNVARNPVARAVQRAKLASAMREFSLTLYFLEDGTEQSDNIQAAAKVLAVALRLVEMRGLELHRANVMRGAMSCLEAASNRRFVWRSQDAPAIDAGMERAAEIVTESSAQDVQQAWVFVESQEFVAA